MDLQPCPRYERLQHGLSVWFSLCSDCDRLESSLPNCVKCIPRPSGWPWRRESLPGASAPSPPGAGWSHLLCSFFPLPSWPFFPFSYRVLYGSEYFFSVVRKSCQCSPGLLWELLSLWMFLMHPWREVIHPSVILSTPICACISNEFPFLLSNIAITTYI